MLNKNLNIDELRNRYSENNRVTIGAAFDNEIVEKLLCSLKTEIPWQLAYMEKGVPSLFSAEQLANMSEDDLNTVYGKIVQLGKSSFQFCYYHYSVSHKNRSECSPDAYIHTFRRFLQSEDFFDFAKAVTGITEVSSIEIQTARYTANNFLMMHNDSSNPRRRFAYVLNLSKKWHLDWGGLLHFISREGKITETFVPSFNSLTFFTVPALHKVSYVMPFVKESRYTVTGWLGV